MIEKDEWFPDVGEYLPENGTPPNPLDSMPIARYHDWEDTAPSEYEPPMEEDDWFIDKPKQEEKTIHHKMYEIATARNNPFHVGGSENIQSDVDYIKKHSPWPGGSEQHMPPRPEEQIYDEFNDPYGGR
jgi:hypothetical protein